MNLYSNKRKEDLITIVTNVKDIEYTISIKYKYDIDLDNINIGSDSYESSK